MFSLPGSRPQSASAGDLLGGDACQDTGGSLHALLPLQGKRKQAATVPVCRTDPRSPACLETLVGVATVADPVGEALETTSQSLLKRKLHTHTSGHVLKILF